jgi:hypothetical protein
VKMLGEKVFHIGIATSLAVILGVLVVAVVASIIWPKPQRETSAGT